MPLPQLRRVRWAVRATLLLGVAASVVANVLHALDNPISQAIAAWPPLALLLTVELISRVPVHRRSLAAARLVATATIAGIAAWVSYWHMVGVAARYGETGASPYLLPLSVDGLIVVASICLVELAGRISTLERPAEPATSAPAAPIAAGTPVAATAPVPVHAVSERAVSAQAVSERAVSAQAVSAQAVSERAVSAQAVSERAVSERAISEETVSARAVSAQTASERAVSERAAASAALAPSVAEEIAGLLGSKPSKGSKPQPAPLPRQATGHRPAATSRAAASARPAPAGRATPPGARIPELTPEATKQARPAAKVRRTPSETLAEATRIKADDPQITDSALAAALGISTARWRTIRRESPDHTLAA